MLRPVGSGWIEAITGVMFSGKSEELIRRVRRAVIARKQVQVFKSHLDDRYGVYAVTTHDGSGIEAHPVDSSAQIVRKLEAATDVVGIDEAQFLDDGIVDVCGELAEDGRRVIIAGTDMDFRGHPFGPMPALLAVAEVVDKLHAICARCGAAAHRNQRLINGIPAPFESPTIMVGGTETYEARCRRCHDVPRVDRAQVRLL